ncbi:hypothetical protein DW322_05085 [Rhodococcus rhodnii]|uniref:SdpI family protein n=1 Tax=Rhodococcus rhodnii TaxID=38312 RepID=A0A6P2CKS2_9NOCA|nr:SdpI family protein [Rhodococcus rhodnii]TXG92421.1 hypothetical protein DW322_05085 [Rhodococcus rhodnii]
MLVVSVLLFVLAVAVGTVAVLGLTGRLPRNRWAGVRTPAALASDDAFSLANKVAAPTLLAGSLLLVLGGLGGILIGGGFGIAVVVVGILGALLTTAAGGTIGAKASAALPAEDSSCGPDACGSCSLKGACSPS